MGLRNTFERMMTARELQARRYVNGALLSMDDETLRAAGFNRKDLKAEGAIVYPF